jgi:hypothetical protein
MWAIAFFNLWKKDTLIIMEISEELQKELGLENNIIKIYVKMNPS